MHEDQPQPTDHIILSPTDMHQLGERFVAAVAEQKEGGLTDQSIREHVKEQKRVEDILVLMRQELEERNASMPLIEDALADVVSRLTKVDDLADDEILTSNMRQIRTKKRELLASIAELEEKIGVCEAYIANIRERILGLESRSDRIKKAMGHYAAFRAEIESLPIIESVPSLYSELHKDQTIIADTDLKEVTKIVDKSDEGTAPIATVSISVPMPQPTEPKRLPEIRKRLPEISMTELKIEHEEPVILPIPGGKENKRTFVKQRRSADNLIGNR